MHKSGTQQQQINKTATNKQKLIKGFCVFFVCFIFKGNVPTHSCHSLTHSSKFTFGSIYSTNPTRCQTQDKTPHQVLGFNQTLWII